MLPNLLKCSFNLAMLLCSRGTLLSSRMVSVLGGLYMPPSYLLGPIKPNVMETLAKSY